MKILNTKLLFLLIPLFWGCQNATPKKPMVETIEKNIVEKPKTKTPYDLAIESVEAAKIRLKKSKFGSSILYDSIPAILRGTTIDNIVFTDVNNNKIDLSAQNKPIFIQVSTSPSIPNKTEIPAINQLAFEYKDDVKFILIACSGVERYNRAKEHYDEGISVITSEEFDCQASINVQGFKHVTGYPFHYFLDKELKIINCGLGDYYESPERYADYREKIYNTIKTDLDALLKKN